MVTCIPHPVHDLGGSDGGVNRRTGYESAGEFAANGGPFRQSAQVTVFRKMDEEGSQHAGLPMVSAKECMECTEFCITGGNTAKGATSQAAWLRVAVWYETRDERARSETLEDKAGVVRNKLHRSFARLAVRLRLRSG
jgi:hypothetical protein